MAIKKLKGAILLEPLVAIVIISAVMIYATFSLNNIFMGNNNYLKFKALIQLEKTMLLENDLTSDSFDFDTFLIEKKAIDYNQSIIELHWIIRDKRRNRTLATIKEYKNIYSQK